MSVIPSTTSIEQGEQKL